MKKLLFLILLLTLTLHVNSQSTNIQNEKQIQNVINQFFDALENKDTLLLRQTMLEDAQVWRRRNNEDPVSIDFRFSRDDMAHMPTMPDVKEIAKDFDINIKDGIACAWVPYEFYIEGRFSHCGVDVFTLFEIDGEWMIVSAAYTVEKSNCDK